MTIVPLDTHEVVKELKAAGFNDEQAEAVTRVVRKAQDLDLSNLATKTDLETLRVATKADLAETKADILKWMIGAMGFQTVMIIGAVVALSRALSG